MSALTLLDSSLRDGMHSVGHSFTPAQVTAIAGGLDRGGVDVIEVTHGDGLGGSSIQYGESLHRDEELIAAAVAAVSRAQIAVLLLPGIGTLSRLREAQALGATVARIATHCTEADISAQQIAWAAENGMRVASFLMMSHMAEPAKLAEQALLMESYGSQCVYVVDSAGALVPDTVTPRVQALRAALDDRTAVGIHTHNNLGCGVGNALAGVAAGATWVDGSIRGLGASAGNAQLEVLAAALERSGQPTNANLFELMDLAENVVAPLQRRPQIIDRTGLTIGYAGVYSSFLLHAERAAAKYGVDARDVLMELGRQRVVGGQEDMIIEVAEALGRRARIASQEAA